MKAKFPVVLTEATASEVLETPKTRLVRQEGDFRLGRNDPKAPVVEIRKPVNTNPQQGQQQFFKVMGKSTALEGLSVAVWKYRKSFFNPKGEPTTRRRDRILTHRCFQRDELLVKLKKLIDYFKQRVSDVRNERIELQLDIKLMSIGLLVLIQELDIVKEFDSAEKAILERLRAQKVECETARERVKLLKINPLIHFYLIIISPIY